MIPPNRCVYCQEIIGKRRDHAFCAEAWLMTRREGT